MKIQVLWDVMPCKLVNNCPEDGGITLLHSAGNCLQIDIA
jgi:hypothetical protein